MNATTPCRPSVRRLHPWEIEAARIVFGDNLDYDQVRVHECTTWTDQIDKIGRRLKRMPPLETHNALTLGNHCYFPVRLPDHPVGVDHPDHYKLCWLIHEITHAWQYQKLGWRYLAMALQAQFTGKAAAYDFGQEEGLKKRRKDGWSLKKFNLEQQGDIARSYYERIQRGQDISEWQPYVEDFQRLG
jgi:hypothetical protein